MLSLTRQPRLALARLHQVSCCVSTSGTGDQTSPTSPGPRKPSKRRTTPSSKAAATRAKFPLPKWTPPKGADTGVVIRNALTKTLVPLRAEPFKPLSWYMCGPTVYDSTHIGHAHCYMKFDIIRKILKNFFNVRVRLVVNITDVDDKVILRSEQLGVPVAELTRKYETEFLDSLDRLKIERATAYIRVTDHIPAIADYIQVLVNKGYAYHSQTGDVNFDSIKFRDERHAGKLEPKKFKGSERTTPAAGKRHAADFALWKHSKPHELGWDVEWTGVGLRRGRPGWHIECSTLAKIAFGDHVDIHTGGADLRFPHHENEIVQSEAYHDTDQWVDYFMHCGTLRIDGSKMSKSLGNFITVDEFLAKHSPDKFRMICCMSQYHRDCEYDQQTLETASTRLATLANFNSAVLAYVEGKSMSTVPTKRILSKLASTENKVLKALGKNFSVQKAISELLALATFVEAELADGNVAESLKKPRDGRRSGAVLAVHTFIRHTLQNMGFEVAFMELGIQASGADSGNVPTEHVLRKAIDEFMAFRAVVRDLSIGRVSNLDGLSDLLAAHHGDAKTEKQLRKEYTRITAPFLEASDELRADLMQKGVEIKDRGVESSWDLLQK
eukprot:scpid56429/ scgid25933/ Probable cysteine--tRNA ligase, mitochondrial; Cysteinyl-tRNA synthetase